MGDILLLPTRTEPARTPVAGGSATILFFTGVRYCRLEVAPEAPSPTVHKRRRAPKKSQRNRVELQA